MKEKRKLRDKMALNMVIPGDTLEVTDDMELFNIKKIKKKHVRTLNLHRRVNVFCWSENDIYSQFLVNGVNTNGASIFSATGESGWSGNGEQRFGRKW